jgi:RNA polymerase sigma factor (sigma-70 family)
MSRWEDLDDAALLAATATDPEAFAAFYRRHVAAVLAYCRRRTGAADLAFDLAAEVFAAALESSGRYRPERPSAAPWLYGIARNKAAESARDGRIQDRARRRLKLEPVELTDHGLALVEEATGDEPLALLLDGLPAAEHDAVRARVVEEREYDEIATALRCSQQVVRKRVSRGLSRLRAHVEGDR